MPSVPICRGNAPDPAMSEPEETSGDERKESAPAAGAAICCPVTVTCDAEESVIVVAHGVVVEAQDEVELDYG